MDLFKYLLFIISSCSYFRMLLSDIIGAYSPQTGYSYYPVPTCSENCFMWETHVIVREIKPKKNEYYYTRRGVLVRKDLVLVRRWRLIGLPPSLLRVSVLRGDPKAQSCHEYDVYRVRNNQHYNPYDKYQQDPFHILELFEEIPDGRIAKIFKPHPDTRKKELSQLCNNKYRLIGHGNNTSLCCNKFVSFRRHQNCRATYSAYQECLSTLDYGTFVVCGDTFYAIMDRTYHQDYKDMKYVYSRLDEFDIEAYIDLWF